MQYSLSVTIVKESIGFLIALRPIIIAPNSALLLVPLKNILEYFKIHLESFTNITPIPIWFLEEL